jgi:transcriptional regulator with XRE-family HTH domain
VAAGIGERIRRERKRRGWSQHELSGRSGVTQPDLSAIEAGQQDPRLSTLQKLATAFRLSLGALVDRARERRLRSRLPLPTPPSEPTAREQLAEQLRAEIRSLVAERHDLERSIWGDRDPGEIIDRAVDIETRGFRRTTLSDLICAQQRIALTPLEARAPLEHAYRQQAQRRAGTRDAAQRLAVRMVADIIAAHCHQAGLTPKQYRAAHASVNQRLDATCVRLAAVDPEAFTRFYTDAVSCGDVSFAAWLLDAARAGLPDRHLWTGRTRATTPQGRERWEQRRERLLPPLCPSPPRPSAP